MAIDMEVMMRKISGNRGRRLIVLGLLILILSSALFLRFWRLDQAPYGALVDEINFGYISYSLLKTGADEHGVSWPLIFQGFGDQKLPAYAYVLMPFIAVFDLTVAATRMPSALVGTISVLLMFFLLRKLLNSEKAALTGTLITALSPMPFFLSRFALESNLALFFWLISLNGIIRISGKWYWALSAGLFSALTWYTYIAYRPVTFVFILFVLVFGWFKLRESRRNLLLMAASFVLVVSPFLLSGFGGSNSSRFKQVGIFYDPSVSATIIEQRNFCMEYLPKVWCYAAFNKITWVAPVIGSRFLAVYSPEYLASDGIGEEFLTVRGYGQFFQFLYPVFIFGILILFSLPGRIFEKKQKGYFFGLVILGILVTPVPAVLAGNPQKVRLSPLLPFLVAVYTIGIHQAWRLGINWYKSQKYLELPLKIIKFAAAGLVISLYFIGVFHFYTSYFTVHVIQNDHMYQSELRRAMLIAADLVKNDTKLVVTDKLSEPMMFYAFYSKMNPKLYQEQIVLSKKEASGFQHAISLKDVYTSSSDINTIACRALYDNQPTYYLSSEDLGKRIFGLDTQYTIDSGNGSISYLFIYDALAYAQKNNLHCDPAHFLKAD